MLSSGWLRGPAQQFFGRCLFAAAVGSTASCSILVDSGREQCATTADCQKRGAAFAKSICSQSVCITDPVWGCVGTVVWPSPPPVPSPEKVTARLALSNLLTKMVVAGATARVCGKLDGTCASPIQTGLTSGSDGVLTVPLDKFFDGYLEIHYPNTDPSVDTVYVDTLYFFNPPVDADRNIPFIPLVPTDALTVFGDQLKMMPRLDRGTVIGLSYDCQGNGAEGIQLASDEGDEYTAPFYMADGFPSLAATQTDKSGQGGIANVPVGPRHISGRLADTGELIGTVNVQTRAIQITYTSMLPTPLSSQK